VRAVRRAERIVHEQVEVICKSPGGLSIVLCLARIEARVLEHGDPLVGEELTQPGLDRLHRERGVRPTRPAEMRADDDLGSLTLEQQLERRQRDADPRVVGHLPVLERDVQVRADENPPAGDIGVSNGPRAFQSRRSIRSTSRHE
jgi:hypothetical protein